MQKLVVIENNQALTDSRIVAKHFGKKHKVVLLAIREILAAENCATKFFYESSYDNRGKSYPMFLMNRDGFSLLAMGFTGKQALKFKLAFIDEFNRMEKLIAELADKAKKRELDRDPRWEETRELGKKTRKLLTSAIRSLEDYFQARGKMFNKGYLYGHLTNLIQNALGVEKGGRDIATTKKLNQLDQAEDIAGNIILQKIADREINSLAEIDANILLQLKRLNQLLSGQLFLPANKA